MNNLFSSIVLASVLLMATAQGAEEYGPVVFYDTVSVGSLTNVQGVAIRYTTNGVYTNGAALTTNYYRIDATNRAGRFPLGTNVVAIFRGGVTNGTNAVSISWRPKGGAAGYVVNRSFDFGATWTNWVALSPAVTNWTDYGTGTQWISTSFTNVFASAPVTPTVPWPASEALPLAGGVMTGPLTNNTEIESTSIKSVDADPTFPFLSTITPYAIYQQGTDVGQLPYSSAFRADPYGSIWAYHPTAPTIRLSHNAGLTNSAGQLTEYYTITYGSDGSWALSKGSAAAGYRVWWHKPGATPTNVIAGHIIPATSNAVDLGSAEAPFRSLYVGPGSIHMGPEGNAGTAVFGFDTNTSSLLLETNMNAQGLGISNVVLHGIPPGVVSNDPPNLGQVEQLISSISGSTNAFDDATNVTDIVILAGQSNAEGIPWYEGAAGSAAPAPYNNTNTSARIWWEDSNRNVHQTNQFVQTFGTNWGSEVAFARHWTQARSNRTNALAIVKVTYGGAALASTWAPTNVTYALLRTVYANATNTLRTAGLTPRVRGVLWMQGEADAGSSTQSAAYQDNLTNLIASFRTDFGAGVPVVIGKISPALRAYEGVVRAAQENVASNVSGVAIVRTDDMPLFTDLSHYTPAGLIALGRAWVSALGDVGSSSTVENDLAVKGAMSADSFNGDGRNLLIDRYASRFDLYRTNVQQITAVTLTPIYWNGVNYCPSWMRSPTGGQHEITFQRTGMVVMDAHPEWSSGTNTIGYSVYLYRNGSNWKFGRKLSPVNNGDSVDPGKTWVFYNDSPTNRYSIYVRTTAGTALYGGTDAWTYWSGFIIPDDAP